MTDVREHVITKNNNEGTTSVPEQEATLSIVHD
jgi:hypothetical protein